MLGSLAHFRDADRIAPAEMPELERLMLHRLAELDGLVRQAYADFDYKRIFAALNAFMTSDLSAFYFDIRKDALYCDPISSVTRKACLTVLDHLFRATVTWLAPMLPFTAEEAWLARYPSTRRLRASRNVPRAAGGLARRGAGGEMAQGARSCAASSPARSRSSVPQKRIGSSLEAAPIVYVSDGDLFAALVDDRSRGGLDHVGGDAGRRRRSGERVPARRGQGRRGRGAARGREEMRAVLEDPAERRLRSRLSRRLAARRPGAARVGRDAQGSGVGMRLMARKRNEQRPAVGTAHPVRPGRRAGDRGDRSGAEALAPVRRRSAASAVS